MLWDVRPRQIAGPEDAMVDEIAEGKIVHAVSGADPSDRTLAGDRSDRVQRAFDQVSFASRVEIRQRSVVDPSVAHDFVAARMEFPQRIGKSSAMRPLVSM